jgi:hypothetical protein
MLAIVRGFVADFAEVPKSADWGRRELAHLERNADLFRARLPA